MGRVFRNQILLEMLLVLPFFVPGTSIVRESTGVTVTFSSGPETTDDTSSNIWD